MEALVVTVALIGLAIVFVWLGYQLAQEDLEVDHQQVEFDKQVLAAEWRALDETRRIRLVFMAARRAMQEEAQRSAWPQFNAPEDGAS